MDHSGQRKEWYSSLGFGSGLHHFPELFCNVTFLQEIKNNQAGDEIESPASSLRLQGSLKARDLHSAFRKAASFGSEFSMWTSLRSRHTRILCFARISPCLKALSLPMANCGQCTICKPQGITQVSCTFHKRLSKYFTNKQPSFTITSYSRVSRQQER